MHTSDDLIEVCVHQLPKNSLPLVLTTTFKIPLTHIVLENCLSGSVDWFLWRLHPIEKETQDEHKYLCHWKPPRVNPTRNQSAKFRMYLLFEEPSFTGDVLNILEACKPSRYLARFSDGCEKSKSIDGFPITILRGNKRGKPRPCANNANFMIGEIRNNDQLTLCAMVANYHRCEPILLFKYVTCRHRMYPPINCIARISTAMLRISPFSMRFALCRAYIPPLVQKVRVARGKTSSSIQNPSRFCAKPKLMGDYRAKCMNAAQGMLLWHGNSAYPLHLF